MPGSIVKRGKNSWSVIVDLGRDPVTGKRRRAWQSVKGSKREAERLLTQLLHQRDQGIDVLPGKLTLGEYLERWLRDYAEPNTAAKTYRNYQDVVRRHLIPALGSLPLTKLRPQHIQAHYSQALQGGRLNGKGGLSGRSVLRHHQVLHTALRHAVRWQLIASNPADAVEAPRGERHEIHTVGPEEVRALLAAADKTPLGTLIELAVMTGLRQGEMLGLRWEDVDLDAGTLHVRQVCQWLPGQGFAFKAPKTAGSRRAVALAPETVRRLRQHRARQAEEKLALGAAYADHGLVFATPLGTPLDPANLRRAWTRIVRDADVGHLRFHDLRHSHASLLLQNGVHPKIVSERLGHSGVGITLDIYSHVLPNLQAEAAAGLERLLAGKAAKTGAL